MQVIVNILETTREVEQMTNGDLLSLIITLPFADGLDQSDRTAMRLL